MHVKRFFAKDMAKALKNVRTELGSDAVILSNQMVQGGVEVVAAQDYDMEADTLKPDSNTSPQLSQELKKTKLDLVLSGVNEKAYHELTPTSVNSSSQPESSKIKFSTIHHTTNRTGSSNDIRSASRKQPLADLNTCADLNTSKETLRKELASLKQKREAKQRQQTIISEEIDRSYDKKPEVYESSTELKTDRDSEQNPGLTLVHSELNNIKALLESQFNGIAWQNFVRHTPVQAGILKRLLAMGLSASITDDLLSKLDDRLSAQNAWRHTLAYLAQKISVTSNDLADQGGIIALVGPAGAGKTTTIGKLAARYVIQHGADTVALISVDTYRIAGHEQLRAFARILGIPLRVVNHVNKLKHTLDECRKKKLVLIDTAGLHPQDTHFQHQLNLLKEAAKTIQSLLVLSCTSQVQVLKAAWQAYKSLGVSNCVLTKLDEAGSLGAALEIVIKHQLAVAYETNGQHIPDDIHVSRPHSLVAQAVSLADAVVDDQTLSHAFAKVDIKGRLVEKDSLNGAA